MGPSAKPDLTADSQLLADIDLPAVTAWLLDAVGLTEPLELSRVGQGQSNLTFLVQDAAGRQVILRRPPLGTLARGAHDMLREHRVLAGLAAQPVPTPQPLAMAPSLGHTGAPIYAMEHVSGIVLHTLGSADPLDVTARGRAAASAVEALAALHRVDIDETGLGELSRRDGYAERQIRGWLRQWEATRTRDLPLIEGTAAALRASIPPQHEVAIVHGDYNLANLIVGEDGEVRAILDWELCTLGDPVADLATMLCYWPDSEDQVLMEREPLPLMPGFPRRAELVRTYVSAAPDRNLAGLPFWLALATWKLAVILEGVTRRRMENPANSHSSPSELRGATDRLAHAAAALAAG